MLNLLNSLNEDYKKLVDETPYEHNGLYVPRVTSIISNMIHEDYLLKWANWLGFKRRNYKDEVEKAASKGTFVHHFIEDYINEDKEPDMESVPRDIYQEVQTAYSSFQLWWSIISGNEYEILMQETKLICPLFGGTLDILIKINGKIYLMDFKTSNHVSYKYFLQMAAYRYMLKLNYNIDLDGVGVIMFNKKEVNFTEYILNFSEVIDRLFMDECLNSFLSLSHSYYCKLRVESMFKEVFTNDKKRHHV